MTDEPTAPMDTDRVSDIAPLAPDPAEARAPALMKTPTEGDQEELQHHLPQYRVRELLGRGGMGSVIKVDDPKLTRTVALKVMKLGAGATEEQRGRFAPRHGYEISSHDGLQAVTHARSSTLRAQTPSGAR